MCAAATMSVSADLVIQPNVAHVGCGRLCLCVPLGMHAAICSEAVADQQCIATS